MGWLRQLYDWVMRLAAHKRAGWALFGVSFMESSFFPIPPHVMLIPMVLADRSKALVYWLQATIGSVLGGLFGYAIGYFLFAQIGEPILELYGAAEKFAAFKDSYNENGAWIVFTFGVTPFPYKVITIASGTTQLDLMVFTVTSIIARGLIFGVIVGLLYAFGPPIRDFIERRLGILTILFVALLIGGFVAIKFLL
ncbi:MAG: YqaA family protein [Pseudomonadota bacterium]